MTRTRLPFCSPYRLFIAAVKTPRSVADDIHEAYAAFVWRGMTIGHLALVGTLTTFWPILFLVMAWMFTRKIGGDVKAATGKSIARQLWEQLSLATLYSIPPDKYYVFELFRDDRRSRANEYILRYELKGAFHNLMQLHAAGDPKYGYTKKMLTDKLSFFRRCQEANVVTPLVLAYVERHPESKAWNLHRETGTGTGLPRQNIFIKPVKGKGGRGCEKWVYENNTYRGPNGLILNEGQLLDRIFMLADQRGRYLVQECLENHRALLELGESLTSLRITSCRNEQGRFEVTNATLKLSFTPGKSVDNFHQGGGVAMVDIASGRVGPASDSWKDRPCTWHKASPVNGAPIEGRVLPCWKETVEAVERAHGLFPERFMLGFDVAITERGPVIIEGNVQSGCDMIQRTHDKPVGGQRLGQLLAFHATTAVRLPHNRWRIRWFGPFEYFRPR